MSVTALHAYDRGAAAATRPASNAPSARHGRSASTPASRLNGHWLEFLFDLALLGEVRLESATESLRIEDRVDLSALRIVGRVATLPGEARSLRLLLDRCHAIATTTARDCLILEDNLGQPVLRLLPVNARDTRLWQIVVGATCGRALRVTPASATTGSSASAQRPTSSPETAQAVHATDALDGIGDDGAPDFQDTAELTGQVALQLARLRRERAQLGRKVVAVDPALIPHALRAMSDELLPLVVTTGSDALALRRRAIFHRFDLSARSLRLASDDTAIEIDPEAIDSAWVLGTGACGRAGRQLRLYDGDGRALAVIAADANNGDEPHFWCSLMNALEA